jgi:hypothetical protein
MQALRAVLNILLPVQKLHTLRVRIQTSLGERPSIPPMPLYFHSARVSHPADSYDLTIRPATHPLSKFRSIRNLMVDGNSVASELEEAIFKLTLNMEKLAQKEKKSIRAKERNANLSFGLSWVYSLKIEDHQD